MPPSQAVRYSCAGSGVETISELSGAGRVGRLKAGRQAGAAYRANVKVYAHALLRFSARPATVRVG